MPGNFVLGVPPRAANEADWIERRVRTISRGYVKNTEVIPARPPHTSRLAELRSAPGEGSKNYDQNFMSYHRNTDDKPYPLVEVVATKLYSGVWNNTYTICAVASHETSPALLFIPVLKVSMLA
jgi:hypothetical protein